MDTDARILMDELRLDHRNMAIVLNIMEGLVEEMEAGKDPDHPKGDVLYEKLRDRRPDLAEDLDHVPDEHREIARLGTVLRSEVEAINAGAAVRRQKMIEDTAAYITLLRNHMLWEEEDLFSRIDLMLNAEPYTVDISRIEQIKDPVFELEVEAGFRRLLDSLAVDRA